MTNIEGLLANGFQVVRGVYGRDDIRTMAAAFDEVKAQAYGHAASWRHGNLLFAIRARVDGTPLLRFAHWPVHVNPVLERYRTDARQLALIRGLVGTDVKQIANQAVWKDPGEPDTVYGWHQDARFRRPASAFRELATSFVQVFIAIDAHDEENGCLHVVRRSHLKGLLPQTADRTVMEQDWRGDAVSAFGLDPADVVPVVLDPGDVAIWLPYVLHGSGPNRSTRDRRAYVNGYVRAITCDRGAWAFRDGRPCPIGAPVLIQYEDVFTRPEPHYVDGPLYPPPVEERS